MKKSTKSSASDTETALLSTNDVASCLGIAPHFIRYWVKIGLLSANGQRHVGRGGQLMFSVADLRNACLIRTLDKASIKPQQIARIIEEVRRIQDDPTRLVDPLLIPYGTTQLILQRASSGRTMIMDASRPGQYVMTIVLENLDEEVRRMIAQTK